MGRAPGVYIEYRTDGPLTVRSASTSTAVFIGTTAADGTVATAGGTVTPVLVTDVKEYGDRFAPAGNRLGTVTLPTVSAPGVDHMGHAIAGFFGNGGAKAYIVSNTVAGTGAAASVIFTVTNGTTAGAPSHKWAATAKGAGTWGNDIDITLSRSLSGAGFVDVVIALAYSATTGDSKVERFLGIAIDRLGDLSSSFVTFAASTGTSTGSLDSGAASPSPLTASLAGGTNATAGGKSMAEICEALKDIDDISLIILPGKDWSSTTDKADYGTAIAHAQEMRDRMVLIQMQDNITDWANVGLPQTQYASAYYPNGTVVTRNGAGNAVTQTIGLTGHVAGVIARTDNTQGAWTSAAGTHAYVSGIAALTANVSQAKQGPINDNCVNAVRMIAGMPTVFGARTRDKGGIYEYQAVTRTAFLIADSLRDALGRAVFAKNTEVLWGNLKLSVAGFMQTLFAQGAFQGASADQAFEVACGLGENMVQADIDGGTLRVTVRFRPAKPAEVIEVVVEQLFAAAA